ncbi:MAG: hypothetical protein KatS3mg111_2044 [Pirellulaceae bacterium]|nr:MAG: hypothetical protein KatS3mg111_2044 [Pirellulaceae bacterium]
MNSILSARAFVLAFFAIAVALRLVPHEYNLTAIGALGLFAGYYWSATAGLLFSMAAMAVSDMVGHWLQIPSMGVYDIRIMLPVYLAMGASGLIGRALAMPGRKRRLPLWLVVPGGAAAASLAFFLISNFAVWIGPYSTYPRNVAGLVECYVAAIPFIKNTILGNFLFSAIFFGSYAAAGQWLGSHAGAHNAELRPASHNLARTSKSSADE